MIKLIVEKSIVKKSTRKYQLIPQHSEPQNSFNFQFTEFVQLCIDYEENKSNIFPFNKEQRRRNKINRVKMLRIKVFEKKFRHTFSTLLGTFKKQLKKYYFKFIVSALN